MRYQITGKHMDVGEALRTYVTDAMQAVIEKYAERPTDAIVVFSKRGHEFRCEATLHLSTGLTAQAHAAEHEVYGAFDQCCEKMEKQLRRYKRRLKDHHRERSQPVEAEGAAYYVMASDGDGAAEEPQSLEPMIIAELETRIPSISVGEAVMQMELKGAPILVFRNETSSGVNVVYRRDDGNIGWIDPGGTR
ncbi:MAG: ribosome-associated translation inhibitor RaiA [Pseudomonadota bacterium]